MKVITVSVTETASYERKYLVDDDFDQDSAEDLFVNDENAITSGFQSVDERDAAVTDEEPAPVNIYDVDERGRAFFDVDFTGWSLKP